MATKIDHEAVRSAWLKNAEAEARLWLAHLDAKQRTIVAAQASKLDLDIRVGRAAVQRVLVSELARAHRSA